MPHPTFFMPFDLNIVDFKDFANTNLQIGRLPSKNNVQFVEFSYSNVFVDEIITPLITFPRELHT